MKLCRFELATAPGHPRVGIYYNGKVYETDGAEGVGVHEVHEVSFLAPVKRPVSFRVFSDHQINAAREATLGFLDEFGLEERLPTYSYRNPGSILGPGSMLPMPDIASELTFEPLICVVIGEDGFRLSEEAAERIIIGYCLGLELIAPDLAGYEAGAATGPGQSRDFGCTIGPVLVTPEDIQEYVRPLDEGMRLDLEVATTINGNEVQRTNLLSAQWSFAELIAGASRSCPLHSGDLFAVSLISSAFADSAPPRLQVGDRIQVSSSALGMLTTTLIGRDEGSQ